MVEKRATRDAKELWDLIFDEGPEGHEVEEVHEELDDGWRHGNYVYTVVKETTPDGTVRYWGGNYQVSGDGDYNSWRDGEIENFYEVFPKTVIKEVTTYE